LLTLKSCLLLVEAPCEEVVKVIFTYSAFDWWMVSLRKWPLLFAEDIDYSLRVCFKALAISEHLIEPDNYWIIKLYPFSDNNIINCLPGSSCKRAYLQLRFFIACILLWMSLWVSMSNIN
jgi:hypothetical protein